MQLCQVIWGFLLFFLLLGQIEFDGSPHISLALLSATILPCLLPSHKCLVFQPELVLPFPLEEAHTNLFTQRYFHWQISETDSRAFFRILWGVLHPRILMWRSAASWLFPFKRSKQVNSSGREEPCNNTGCFFYVSPGLLGKRKPAHRRPQLL